MGWSRKALLRAARAVALATSAVPLAACAGEYPQTTFEPVTDFGVLINEVFATTVWWTMGILVVVLVLILVAVLRFRERPGTPEPKQIHGSVKLEIAWTIVPAIIVVMILVPTVSAIFETQRRPSEDALTIEVIGHQWWWEFRYPEYDLVTANLAYMPTGREIHLQMHSADVIHSFWVPRLGGKRDVNPRPRQTEGEAQHSTHLLFTIDQPGTYDGQCAEFCGASHAIMRIAVEAVEPADFERWVEDMRAAPQEPPAVPEDTAGAAPPPAPPGALPEPTGAGQAVGSPRPDSLQFEGRRIFGSRTCVACHAIQGVSAGQLGPDLTLFGRRPTVGAGALPNTLEDVEAWIKDPQAVKPGALMPGAQRPLGEFPATGLTDAEIRAVAAYLLSLK
jgi:cytochrome c oxidase subunit 2